MLAFIIVVVLVVGLNTVLWGSVGLGRVAHGFLTRNRATPGGTRLTVNDVCVLVAAHNEEQVIEATVQSAHSLVPAGNVFVASDGSSDGTAHIARDRGAEVLELNPNRGKAGALAAAIEHFELAERFQVVLLLDADTHLAEDYMTTGLPFFDDPAVVAVAGRAATITHPPSPTRLGRFLIAYRERFYVVVQYLLKFGQAARPANVVSIVPGFASMYRTRILSEIDICPPGLAIEDFNMTFEVHAKRLGRIAFHPKAAIAYTQDPDSLGDYISQLRRWTLGFWQTVRRHGFHWGRFWGALVLYVFELVSSSVMLLLVPPLLVVSVTATVWVASADAPEAVVWVAHTVPVYALVLGVLIPDYVLTIFVTVVTRRSHYLILGLGFPLVRMVDAAICLWTIPRAFFSAASRSGTGVWKSPARRQTAHVDTDSLIDADASP